ncbi:MAG: exopolyphosphatase/guanosine-5'-triphosphate,3'-diphosphate pyrophosphatase, partial [Lentisphaeria bacterium]
ENIRKIYLKKGWEIAYGTSGTMKAVAELLVEHDGGAVVRKASLEKLVEETINNGGITSTNVPKLRRDVLPAGLCILQAIFNQLKFETLHVADASLKEGLLYDTMGRLSNHDARIDTIDKLKVQYGIDQAQADRVSNTANKFWKQIKSASLPGISRTKILDWAAQVHEIGLSISHSGYHHHAHYILRHSDLAGFGRYEQYILANLVRAHRKKIDINKFEGLDLEARKAFIPILLCLRLAICLYRRREDVNILPTFRCDDSTYILSFQKEWLDDNPLTLAKLEQEVAYFSSVGLTLSIAS